MRMFAAALVNLYTNDIEAGIRFYRDLLGFAETFRTPREGTPEHVELQLNGFTIGLGTVEAARRVHAVEAAPGSPAMVLVVWTDDVDVAYKDLVAAGVPVAPAAARHRQQQPQRAAARPGRQPGGDRRQEIVASPAGLPGRCWRGPAESGVPGHDDGCAPVGHLELGEDG